MRYIKFKRIIKCSKTLENPNNLLADYPLQIDLNPKGLTVFQNNDYVILDFGQEISGGIRIFTGYVSPDAEIRIRFGESVAETCAELGYKGACNDHSPRDINVKVALLSDLTFGQSGFRFVRLDFKGSFWKVRNVICAVDVDERKEEGYFVCDDPLVNKIWKVASHTLRLNLHNGLFWDGVKRDRLCWIGDTYPEARAANCLYKNIPEVKNTLDFTINTMPLSGYMNNMPTYNMWWLMILADNYRHDGDKEYVLSKRDFVLNQIDAFDKLVDEDGITHLDFNFVDWPSHYNGGDGEELIKKYDEIVGVNFLMQLAFLKIKELFTEFNDKEITNGCDIIISKLKKAKLDVKKYKQIASLGVFTGYDNINNEKILMDDGAKGCSTFQSYFIFSSMARFGHYNEALNILKEYYGGMLKVGSTSFWEDFDIEWLNNASRIDKMPQNGKIDIHGDYGKFCYKGYRHSFCHGWSAGVIPYLVETVAGLKNINFKTYELEPHMSGLTKIKCKQPTPYGPIILSLEMVNNKLVTNIIKCPKEVTIISK